VRRGAQEGWDRRRAGLDLILQHRGADMADIPGGASGLLAAKEADRLVTRIDPGVVALVADLRAQERQAAEKLGQWKTHTSAGSGTKGGETPNSTGPVLPALFAPMNSEPAES
jgi:hypothetical protein